MTLVFPTVSETPARDAPPVGVASWGLSTAITPLESACKSTFLLSRTMIMLSMSDNVYRTMNFL